MNIPGHAIVENKRLEVRALTEADVEPLVRIRKDERMIPFQYMPDSTYASTLETIAKFILENPDVDWFYQVIKLDEETVGEIIHTGNRKKLSSAWNLDPEYWGNGIVPQALEICFNAVFLKKPSVIIQADCFPTNQRCIRAIEKLGFTQVERTRFRDWISGFFDLTADPSYDFI